MVVHEAAVWILLGACSLAGIAFAFHSKHPAAPADRRLNRVGRSVSAILDGVGIGLALAFAMLVAAAVFARLQL